MAYAKKRDVDQKAHDLGEGANHLVSSLDHVVRRDRVHQIVLAASPSLLA